MNCKTCKKRSIGGILKINSATENINYIGAARRRNKWRGGTSFVAKKITTQLPQQKMMSCLLKAPFVKKWEGALAGGPDITIKLGIV